MVQGFLTCRFPGSFPTSSPRTLTEAGIGGEKNIKIWNKTKSLK